MNVRVKDDKEARRKEGKKKKVKQEEKKCRETR